MKAKNCEHLPFLKVPIFSLLKIKTNGKKKMDSMDSIKTIINSKKFQREAPKQLKFLIRSIQSEIFQPEATAFSPMFPTDKDVRKSRKSTKKQKETKKKNVA